MITLAKSRIFTSVLIAQSMQHVTRAMSKDAATMLRRNKIVDNTAEGAFEIGLNSSVARVEYNIEGNVYDLVHSSIPTNYQGLGLGAILAERVFDHLVSRKKQMIISCSYLEKFYLKNREKYEKYVVNPS